MLGNTGLPAIGTKQLSADRFVIGGPVSVYSRIEL